MENLQENRSLKPMTARETASFLGISLNYLYKLTHFKMIPFYRSKGGKKIYFKMDEVADWAFNEKQGV